MQWTDVIKELGDRSDASYALINSEQKIDWVNQTLEQKGFLNDNIRGSYYFHVFNQMQEPHQNCSTLKALNEKRIARKVEQGGDGKQYDTISVPILEDNEVSHVLEITREKPGIYTLSDELHLLKEAADHSNASVFIVDNNYRIVHVNRQFEHLRGIEKQQALGNVPMLFQKKQDHGVHSAFWNTIKKGNVWKQEYEGTKESGETYTSQLQIIPIQDDFGKTSFYLGIEKPL